MINNNNVDIPSEDAKEKNLVMKFHSKRVMFIVYGGEILMKMRSVMSHEEWWKDMNMPSEVDFFSLPRGYILDNKVYFYKGIDFSTDDDLVNVARSIAPFIIQSFNLINPEVYCGMTEGKKGEPWKPVCRVSLGNVDKVYYKDNKVSE